MSAQKAASWGYAEDFVAESEIVEEARRKGQELGCTPIGPGGGATLRMIAAATGAKAVVEVGTGAGVSGLWLLAGMPPEGILTTIDIEAENQRAARDAYAAAGVAHQRTRVITGPALDVLGRMTDGAYDIVLIDADKEGYPAYVEEAARLLRSGGVMVLDNMLWHDKVADPAVRDDTTRVLRDLGKSIRADDRFFATLLPAGDGLLVAVKH
jgi:predicted O-methyltransferase YrrM